MGGGGQDRIGRQGNDVTACWGRKKTDSRDNGARQRTTRGSGGLHRRAVFSIPLARSSRLRGTLPRGCGGSRKKGAIAGRTMALIYPRHLFAQKEETPRFSCFRALQRTARAVEKNKKGKKERSECARGRNEFIGPKYRRGRAVHEKS